MSPSLSIWSDPVVRTVLWITLFAIVIPASGQEPVGCDKFLWQLSHEKALLATASPVKSGSEAPRTENAAIKLQLAPWADAHLAFEPSRKPKPDTYAGFVRLPAPARPGAYRITLSDVGWIDVFQNNTTVKSHAFTGASGCDGLRKSVKFDLLAAPLVIEITGTASPEIAVAITSD